jgi:hypothetical protein
MSILTGTPAVLAISSSGPGHSVTVLIIQRALFIVVSGVRKSTAHALPADASIRVGGLQSPRRHLMRSA